ncbi:unnamed protein product, partial [Didymodactylos carnosus]
FLNGKGYMESVAKAMLAAKEEIFIASWWLSPELNLIRSTNDDQSFRIDNILEKKANEGVRIYILVFKELPFSLPLNSLHTKRALTAKNKKNIKVIRHPDHTTISGESLIWVHHEKFVVIDQKVAFIGGIDLCFGRWDDDDM